MARIHVEAYGCSASSADSEMISGLIVNGGHTVAESAAESDLSVIVTCSVKDATANRMIHRIKSLGSGPLVVAGCLPKAEPKTVERFAPGASMMGPGSIGRTLQVVESALGGVRTVALEDTDLSKVGLPRVRLNPAVGIIEIASGCMSECTFCQTKLAKGGLTSYRVGDIVRQAEADVADGCKEIWLSSTDNGCYGLDIGSDLPELIDAVSAVPRDFMVRVGMMNPMYMPRIRDGLLSSFENERVYRFLHVPVQSGSNRVLADMRRGHTAETFRDVVKRFRRKFGRFTISTDIIVGFPTETARDFEETVRLLEETRPDIVNLSRYSARPGNPGSGDGAGGRGRGEEEEQAHLRAVLPHLPGAQQGMDRVERARGLWRDGRGRGQGAEPCVQARLRRGAHRYRFCAYGRDHVCDEPQPGGDHQELNKTNPRFD